MICTVKKTFIGLLVVLLTGCAGTSAIINAQDLKVQTQASYMPTKLKIPGAVLPEGRKVYVAVDNNSGQTTLSDLPQDLNKTLRINGFDVVSTREEANYIFDLKLYPVVKGDNHVVEALLAGAGTGLLVGTAVGAGAAGVIVATHHYKLGRLSKVWLLSIISATAAGAVINTVFQDVQYILTSEVTVKVKSPQDASILYTYNNRFVTTADQLNLEFKDAGAAVMTSLLSSIGDILPE